MLSIGQCKPGPKRTLDPRRALVLRRTMTWPQVAKRLAEEIGRPVPFTAGAAMRAIKDAGLWDERPR